MAEARKVLDEIREEADLERIIFSLSMANGDLRRAVSNAQRDGVDTTLAEGLLEESGEELARLISERQRRDERKALAREYIPRLEIIGITPPDPTDYEGVISLFEQHEDEILEAENEAEEKRLEGIERQKKAARKKAADELRVRQEWVE